MRKIFVSIIAFYSLILFADIPGISKVYKGTTEIVKAYKGTTEVYSSEWLPTSLSGCVLMLIGDRSTMTIDSNLLTQWNDQSGNDNHFTLLSGSKASTATGNWGAHFTGARYSKSGLRITTSFTIFVSCTPKASIGNQGVYQWDTAYGFSGIYQFTFGGWGRVDHGQNQLAVVPFSDLNLVTQRFDHTAPKATARNNKGSEKTGTYYNASNYGPTGDFILGGRYDAASNYCNAEIYSLIIYNRALSDAEVVQVEDYLWEKDSSNY